MQYAPVSGSIEEINETLSSEPGLLNKSPEEKGWLCKIKLSDPAEVRVFRDNLGGTGHRKSEYHAEQISRFDMLWVIQLSIVVILHVHQTLVKVTTVGCRAL